MLTGSSIALDPPHDASNGYGCDNCHDVYSTNPKLMPMGDVAGPTIDDTIFNARCWSCHNPSGDAPNVEVKTHSSLQTDEGYGQWTVECWVCHSVHTQQQDTIYGTGYGKFIRTKINLANITGLAKTGIKDVKFTANTEFAGSDAIYNGICEVCHTQTTHFRNDGTGTDQLHANMGGVAGTNCIQCHSHADGFKGNGHNDSHFRWDGGCKGCHGVGAAAESVVSGIHANNCDLCHTTGGPYDAGSNKVGENGDGDATLAEGDAGTWTASCVTCHNKALVPGFHGMTIAEVTSIHNNLGSSRGAWADSGGTIPSTRAAGYSGKVDTGNALIDDDYNCADCHDAERSDFTPLEVLEVHLLESGRGNGNCTTCHRALMVADEITSGIGGTTIECEDCHSLANGNGSSGKKMYQYDGKRHHKTMHAQTGNCTRCHADPRPDDLSAEPGYAGTAAVNGTWADGFKTDYGMNHPEPIPTQMACRLCHSNYETYTVDVKAEIDADWDTSELPDLHGYNKNPPAHGLTIYANNFDARQTSLTYQGFNSLDEIRGPAQTTQASIPSHRIEAVDGSSKINVYNYGACFACHTVQVRHAAPKPDTDTNPNNSSEDYDKPISSRYNTHPYDTLRYAPGRSVFNDFQGSGGDAWNNHSKNGSWGWAVFNNNNTGINDRPYNIYGQPTAQYGSIGNNSLVAVPVNPNVNDLESLPGMGATQNIRHFDTGPSLPDIDDITITVANWTGSTVYVEATSSIGAAQSFSFTYSGAGGPCNTTMTWDTNHYEGTCIAASGWQANNTVTVYNNTTTAPDSKTRTLDDLTLNPMIPVLSSILLADNDGTDPFPAEPGYTNDDSGEIEVTIVAGNYPTEMRLSESSTFNNDTDPWIPYESIATFTFNNTTNEEKTVYCQVKNGAGISGTQSSTIVLDTIAPVIQVDTLTTPNGHAEGWQAEFWDTGSSQTITWDAADITDANLKANPIFLKESYDSGNTWRILYIAQNETNDGSYGWTVAGSPITTARIRLEARDKAGNVASDASDNDYNKSTPYIVTNTSDALVAGSLRQVLTDLISAGGNHSLWFNIPDTDPNFVDGVAIISPATNLPIINQDDIYIEGGTQAALRGDTNSKGPEIRINKAGTSTTGFTISGGVFNHIRDLQITGFTTGVSSTGFDTVLEGNHFGFWSDSNDAYTASVNATNATLSDDYPVVRQNFFGCASTTGLDLTNSTSATADSNVFGLFPDPTDPTVPASPADKCPVYGTYAIHVGGNADGADISNNIISGSQYGISVGGPAGGTAETTSNTSIRGNQIGAFYDSDDGWVTARSPQYGVYLATSGGGNTIGGTSVATADDTLNDSNVISPYDPDGAFHYRTGIYIWDAMDYTTRIYGNFIGTNPECDPVNDRGACEVFTGTAGIYIEFATGVTIGGEVNTEPPCQAGNVIANMSGNGAASFGVRLTNWTYRYHTVNCNTFFDNGDGALDDAIMQNYASPTPSRPIIIAADTTTIRVSNISDGNGTTQQGDIVEVYLADFDGTEYGEGVKLVGLTQAVFGQTYVDVDISAAGLSAGDWITATRTTHYSGQIYQTSPFSTNLKITGTTTAPSLDWVGSGNYVADGVNPDSASNGSTFTFRVEYTDTDGTFGEPPVFIEVWIDVDDDGSYESSEKFAMTEVNPGDTDYSDGKLYEKDMVFNIWTSFMADDGVLNYRFTASDGSFHAVTGDPTHALLDDTNTVTLTNTAPVLEWTGETGDPPAPGSDYTGDGVHPDSAPQGSNYIFRVKYTDADNNPPSEILLWIDRDDNGGYSANEDITITPAGDAVPANDGDYTNGEIYTWTTINALNGDGEFNYRFTAKDGAADATGDPTYALLDDTNTVTVENNTPSLDWTGEANYISDGVDPGSGMNASDFTFRVEYTDTDGFIGNAPSAIEVWIDQNGNSSFEEGEKYAMLPVDGDWNHTDGKLYTLTKAVSGSGNVLYRFYATDDNGATAATNGAATGDPTSETLNTVSITNTTAPTLAWTGETNYVGDGVHPGSAASGSGFTFRVDYTDADNDPPAVIEIWIDEDDNLSYEADEKFAMTEVDGGDTVYSDGKRYTLTRTLMSLTEYSNTVHNYRFYAYDGDDATGAPASDNTVTVEPCNMVDPSGTYFEAENFTSTIVQGSNSFTISTYNFDGGDSGTHLQTVGTDIYTTPPTEEGKVYWLNFPTTGNYTVWIRAAKPGSTSQSLFIGKDMVQTNVEVAEGGYWDWEWNTGSPTPITISTAGEHAINIWVREDNFRLDAIYISDGSNPPFDEDPPGPPTGAKVINPSVCQNPISTLGASATASMASVDPDGNPGTDDASISVSMPYFYDDDNDNSYTVDYKLSSEPVVWTNWVTDAAHTASPYITTIPGLTAGESYDVRMTYNDPDGVVDQQTEMSVVLDYVVINANDSGPGSLRQVLTVLLAEGGSDNLIFNIPANLLTDGVAVIDLETNLPTISVKNITIDGASQTANVGDTNTRGPEVRINQAGTSTTGFTIIGVKGRHDGGNDAAVLTDTTASWTINDPDFIGKTIRNVTDNSFGTITSNTETTITATLSGGTDADWDSYDTYRISGIGDGIYIEDLQITGFTTGISSSGYDTEILYNHFGFWSDSNSNYTLDRNGTDAVLSGQYASAFSGNYFGCANYTGLDISDSYDAYVDDNFFGMYPNGSFCSTNGAEIKVNDAVDAYIAGNIISSGAYGIYLGGTTSGTDIRGNQIGVYYSGSVPTGSWVTATRPLINGIRVDTSGADNVIGGSLVALDDDTLRNSNVIKPYGTSTAGTDTSMDGGIYVLNAADNALSIQGNFIGTNPDCDPVNDLPGCGVFTGGRGIMVNDSDLSGLTIGGTDAGEAPNMIANMTADSGNGDGVHVIGSDNVEISRNVFFNNGDNFGDDAIVLGTGANGGITRPAISAATTTTVTVGGVLNGETVEVYHSDYDGSGTELGEGKTFVGSAVSAGTSVTVSVSGVSSGDWVTAIRIQADGNTSPFSTNVQIP